MKLKTLDVILLVVTLICIIASSPWQGVQTNWTLQPGESLTIHWHDCLRGSNFQIDHMDIYRQVVGYTISDFGTVPMTITACDAQ